MRFWDASAVVPLVVREPSSEAMLRLLGADEAMIAWWGTRVECASALRRRERAGALSASGARRALARLDDLAGSWSEVAPTDAVRISAARALAVHPLRAADALQLAAALVWRGERAPHRELICLDDRLRGAASREGFVLAPEDAPGAGNS